MNLIIIGPTLQARSYSSHASVVLIPGPGEVNHEKQHHRTCFFVNADKLRGNNQGHESRGLTHYHADYDGLRSIHGTYDPGPTNNVT